jgi:hypothetical protein
MALIEIDGLPFLKMVGSFHGELLNHQMVIMKHGGFRKKNSSSWIGESAPSDSHSWFCQRQMFIIKHTKRIPFKHILYGFPTFPSVRGAVFTMCTEMMAIGTLKWPFYSLLPPDVAICKPW